MYHIKCIETFLFWVFTVARLINTQKGINIEDLFLMSRVFNFSHTFSNSSVLLKNMNNKIIIYKIRFISLIVVYTNSCNFNYSGLFRLIHEIADFSLQLAGSIKSFRWFYSTLPFYFIFIKNKCEDTVTTLKKNSWWHNTVNVWHFVRFIYYLVRYEDLITYEDNIIKKCFVTL